MQVVRAPAAAGWRWVVEGFSLLRRFPLAILGLTVLFLFTVVLPTAVPVIGGFAPLLLTPALSFGYMQAVRLADGGRVPPPWTLYDGLRAQRGRGAKPLLLLGLINCVVTVAVLALSMLADGGTLFRIATGAISTEDPTLSEGGLVMAATIFLVLYTPVQMAMWYAPMFVGWHQLSPGKALFYSLVAVWRNKAVFTVYMLGWLAVAIGISVAMQLLRLVMPGNLLPLLLSPLSLVMLAALYCSFWPTFRDVVRDEGEDPPVLP